MPSNRVSDCRASEATRNEDRPDPCEVKFIRAQGKENQMFCAECGASINDNAIVCPKCGVAVAGRKVATARNFQTMTDKVPDASPAPLILGIASLITWLFPLIGLPVSIFGIVISAKRNRNGCLTMSIIGAVLSLLNAIVGAVLGSQGKLF